MPRFPRSRVPGILVETNRQWLAVDALFEMRVVSRIRALRLVSPPSRAVLHGLMFMPRFLGARLASVAGGYRFVAYKP